MKKISLSKKCRISLIAALYFSLSIVFAPMTFGQIQMRVSEGFTILPALSPLGIWGVTLGCFLSNLYGAFTGINLLGFFDVLFGTFATFVSALLTRSLRKIKFKGLPVLSTLPPIIINALVIGAESAFIYNDTLFTPAIFIYMAEIALGQLLPCTVLGLILYKALKRGNIII